MNKLSKRPDWAIYHPDFYRADLTETSKPQQVYIVNTGSVVKPDNSVLKTAIALALVLLSFFLGLTMFTLAVGHIAGDSTTYHSGPRWN